MPLKISLNLGYQDQDWFDRFFSDKKDQLVAGIGLKFPIRSSLLYSELGGEFFINNSETVPFMNNLIRFTQGFRFVGPKSLIFDIAGDLRLNSTPDKHEIHNSPFLKDYADWKIVVGMTYRFTLFKVLTAEEKVQRLEQLEEQMKREAIKEKRQKIAEELEEMRKKLEQEKKPKNPEQSFAR